MILKRTPNRGRFRPPDRPVQRPIDPPGPDLLCALAGREASHSKPYLLWLDPAHDLEVVAGGAYRVGSWGSERFEASKAMCSELVEQLGVPGLPLAWLGYSFDSRCWTGWPQSALRLPRWLVYRRGEEGGVLTLCGRAPSLDAPPVPAREAPLFRLDIQSRSGWVQRVEAARRRLERPDLSKLVLARSVRFHRCDGHPFSLGRILTRLRARHPGAVTFAWGTSQGSFVGASPETLVRVRDGVVTTRALAGTAPRGETRAGDLALGERLLACPKNRLEHRLVVDGLRAAMGPRCRGLSAPGGPRLRRLPRVQHLETPFRGRLRPGETLLDLVEALHPTPALGGLPTRPALEWLEQHEGLVRGWFGGPLGWVDSRGDGSFVVAIRCALVRGGDAWAFAGAGIVPDSDPQAEWEETRLKLTTMEEALR